MVEKWRVHSNPLTPCRCGEEAVGKERAALGPFSATGSSSSVGILPGRLPVGTVIGSPIFICLL